MTELRILLVEDNEFDAELVERVLAREELAFVTERADDEESFRRLLGSFEPDLILSDYQLPTFTGMDALFIVQEQGLDTPFIFVSGTLGEEEAVECVRQGATDYVLKDRLARLTPAIVRALADRDAARERRALEEQVRAQEQRMADILRTMPAGFFTMDRELRFTYVNPAAEAMWEIPVDRLLGQSAVEAFPGMQDTEFARAAKSAKGDPVFLEAEYPPKHKWYEVHAYPTDDGYAVYFRDVTGRHRAAAALREAEERYRTIVEQLPAITYVDDYMSGEGGLLYVSPQAESILGFGRTDWLGDPDFWWNHAHPDDRDRVDAIDEASRSNGTPFEAEYRMIAKDGRIVWFHDRAVVLVDPSGKKVVHGVMLDVTERREAEEALRRADAVLGAVTFAADRLLRETAWEAGVEDVLARIGEAAEARRALTIEVIGEPGARRGYAIHEWCAPGAEPCIKDVQDAALEGAGDEWLHRLAAGESTWVQASTATPALRETLARLDAEAAALIPMFTGERFWGLATFVDPGDGRPWATPVMDALTAAANALGAAIGRAEAIASLQRSERDFRSLAENSTDVIARCDRELRFVYVNPMVRELDRRVGHLIGASAETLLSPAGPDIGSPRALDRDRWLDLLRTTFERGERSAVEADHRTERGVRTFEWRLIPEPDETGEVETVLLLGHDVTQHRETEHDLRERMKELACMVEISRGVAVSLDAQELCELTATTLVAAMQYPELGGATVRIGGSVASAGAADGVERLDAAIGEPAEGRGDVSVRYTQVLGFLPEERILLDRVAELLNGWLERREAGRTLRESEERFRFLAENARDVVYRYRLLPTPATEYISPSATAVTGYTPEEYYAQPELVQGTVHPDDRELMLSTGTRPGAEPLLIRWIRRDGDIVWMEQQNSPISGEGGQLVAIEGIARDVTSRIHAEQGQRASYDALIRSNEQRRQLLARLVRAQEEERQRIANDIHDDPIQVMTAVGMRLSLAGRGVTDPAALSDLAQAEDTVRLAIERLRRLLFELHPLSLDSEGLAAALRDHCTLMAKDGGPGAEIDDRLGSEPPPESRVILYRLAQEALTNVRKHAKATAVAISMRSELGGTRLAIRDDGVGFAVDPSRPDPGHLGVRSMVERAESAGGWCRVDSEPGHGTTVEFWVPSIAPPTPLVDVAAPAVDAAGP